MLREEGDTLNLYCCHLPHAMEERESIVRAIIKDIGDSPKRSIVGGDMNSLSFSRPVTMLGRAGLKDAWQEKGRGSGATFHGLIIGTRIDYIFHSDDLLTRSVERLSGEGISDHDAIVARFQTTSRKKFACTCRKFVTAASRMP